MYEALDPGFKAEGFSFATWLTRKVSLQSQRHSLHELNQRPARVTCPSLDITLSIACALPWHRWETYSVAELCSQPAVEPALRSAWRQPASMTSWLTPGRRRSSR